MTAELGFAAYVMDISAYAAPRRISGHAFLQAGACLRSRYKNKSYRLPLPMARAAAT